MVRFLHLLARGAIGTARANKQSLTTAATSGSITCCVPPIIAHVPCKRGLYARAPRATSFSTYGRKTSNAEISSPPKDSESTTSTGPLKSAPPENSPDWCHPYLGIGIADYPRLIHLRIPAKATEEDVEALLSKAGFPDAQIIMSYNLETGNCGGLCLAKLADEQQVSIAVSELSRFTFFGSEFTVQKFDPEYFPWWRQPSLYEGWLPSPSNDLKSRIIRPLRLTPPKLLPPLIAEQWVQFQDLPRPDPNQKESRFKIIREFYGKFYDFDVVGITSIREHPNKSNGWCCKILFGSSKEAKAARKSHIEANTFMGRPAKAKTYRAGPDIHKLLWDYRQSLPEDMPESDISALMEKKFRELVKRNRPALQRNSYPTPESAVGLKRDASTLA